MYSGGKDSTFAIDFARKKGWDIAYLISVKPTRTDCYLFHFATVEHTVELAKSMNIPQIYTTCDIADPKLEAEIVRKIVESRIEEDPIDALILGGIGLQETQIKSIRDALFNSGVEVFATHTGENHTSLMRQMINKGYKIIITQIAADGLTADWLGKELNPQNFELLKKLSEKHGFHIGAEGGHFDTLVIDCPMFTKKIEMLETEKVMESECSGFLKITKLRVKEKQIDIPIF